MWCVKYNANGNDFLIFHSLVGGDYAELARKLCNRHSGIGADGLVVVLPSERYAYEWDFYNADGSKAAMCGNASRCVGHYAVSLGFAPNKHSFLSGAGEIRLEVRGDCVEVNLGRATIKEVREMPQWWLVECGVPHLVSFVESVESLPKCANDELRALRERYNANVNLAYIAGDERITLITYERGVEDITLACGTGMGSVFAAARKLGKVGDSATLIPPSGEKLRLRYENDEVYFKGKVEKIGEIIIDDKALARGI